MSYVRVSDTAGEYLQLHSYSIFVSTSELQRQSSCWQDVEMLIRWHDETIPKMSLSGHKLCSSFMAHNGTDGTNFEVSCNRHWHFLDFISGHTIYYQSVNLGLILEPYILSLV